MIRDHVELIRTKDAAKMLNLTRSSFVDAVARGEIEYVSFSPGGHGYLFSKSSILDIIEDINRYFTPDETEAILHIHRNGFLPLCRDGVLERKKIFGKMYYLKTTVYAQAALVKERKKHVAFFVKNTKDIRRKMKRKKIRLIDIAAALSVSKGIVGRWFNTDSVPSEANATKLLSFLGYVDIEKTKI